MDVLISVPRTVSIALGVGLAAVVDYRLLIAAIVVTVLGSAGYLLNRPAQRPVEVPEPVEVSDVDTAQPPAAGPESAEGQNPADG